MPTPPTPPDGNTELMRFIAQKAKNVKFPMNITELCRQFTVETKTWMPMGGVQTRIRLHRLRIHEMNEFDMETKIKMIFALRAPVDPKFLIQMKKVADVEVDDQQRIIHYKQKDGTLELSAKYLPLSMNQGEKRNKEIMQFLAKKSETTDSPITDRFFSKEFKETTGCSDSIESIEYRYRRVKETIYQSTGIDQNTKIKMMFISIVKLPTETLTELREEADVEVDYKGRITRYKSTDGSLELEGSHRFSTATKSERSHREKLEGSHEMSFIKKSLYSNRWHKICEKIDNVLTEKNNGENANWQNDFERKRINLVRFLIERTKNATFPLSLHKLAKDYKTEYNCSEPPATTKNRIISFRQRIHEMNQFDMSTKVKIMFALSASIDVKFLRELRKYAIVELDEKQRIKRYKASDGCLELEGNHSRWAKRSLGKTRSTETSVLDNPMNNNDNGRDDFDQLSYHYYNERDDAEDVDHIPAERKPENLIEVKIEVPEGPSGGEYDLMEPKIEECTRDVKQKAEEDEEGPSMTFSLNGTRKFR